MWRNVLKNSEKQWFCRMKNQSHLPDLNWKPPVYKTGALPIELRWRETAVNHAESQTNPQALDNLQDLKLHRPARGLYLDRIPHLRLHQGLAHGAIGRDAQHVAVAAGGD